MNAGLLILLLGALLAAALIGYLVIRDGQK